MIEAKKIARLEGQLAGAVSDEAVERLRESLWLRQALVAAARGQ